MKFFLWTKLLICWNKIMLGLKHFFMTKIIFDLEQRKKTLDILILF